MGFEMSSGWAGEAKEAVIRPEKVVRRRWVSVGEKTGSFLPLTPPGPGSIGKD